MRSLSIVSVCLALIGLLALPPAVRAEEGWPDLEGVWTGTVKAVQLGPTPYRPNDKEGVHFSDEALTFTFDITEQHDNRFAGTMQARGGSETILGAMRANKRDGLIQNANGIHEFTLVDPDTIDLCYQHNIPNSRVVACYVIHRKK